MQLIEHFKSSSKFTEKFLLYLGYAARNMGQNTLVRVEWEDSLFRYFSGTV